MTQPGSRSLLLLLFFIGCFSGELTRSRVADLINENAAFAEPVTSLWLQDSGLQRGALNAGDVEGIWQSSMGNDFYPRYTLSSKGLRYFARDFSANERVPLAQASRRELIEVTGITTPPMGGESLRLASFTWQYMGLSPLVARYAGEVSVVHKGDALFQLFDDGWRLQKLELNDQEDRVPFQWLPEFEHLSEHARILQELPPHIAAFFARSTTVEVEAYDKGKGLVMLRDKANGESMTISIEDIEQGRLVIN